MDNINFDLLEQQNTGSNTNSLSFISICRQNIYGKLKNWLILYFKNIYDNFVHIYLIIVFEILFYFNYIVLIEKKEILKILDKFSTYINYILLNLNIIISDNYISNLRLVCNELNIHLTSKNNYDLKIKAYRIIWILSIIYICFTILHLLIYKSFIKLVKNTFKSIIFILFIGLFEIYFFTNIIVHYVSMTNNQAMCYLTQNLIK